SCARSLLLTAPPTPRIYTLSLQRRSSDLGRALEQVSEGRAAVPRWDLRIGEVARHLGVRASALRVWEAEGLLVPRREPRTGYRLDRKSTRLNSSHVKISYAVFCLKKKKRK